MFAEKLAEHILQHVGNLDHSDEEEQQQEVVAVTRNVEQQQGGRVADAIDAEHERPLDLCTSGEEVGGLAFEHRKERQKQERPDRDQNRK